MQFMSLMTIAAMLVGLTASASTSDLSSSGSASVADEFSDSEDVSTSSDSSSISATSATRSTPSPTPVSPYSIPIPTASADSSTFVLVNNVICPDEVATQINALCSINRALFDKCVAESGYQIFPYSGVVPTAEDTAGMVDSLACMAFITSVVLADMPACSISDMPLRAASETLLKIAVDMDNGWPAPTAEQFHAVMAWRRDVDLARAAGVPYGNDSELYAVFSDNLQTALTDKYADITLLSNLTIVIADDDMPNDGPNVSNVPNKPNKPNVPFAEVESGSMTDIVASVIATESTSTSGDASTASHGNYEDDDDDDASSSTGDKVTATPSPTPSTIAADTLSSIATSIKTLSMSTMLMILISITIGLL